MTGEFGIAVHALVYLAAKKTTISSEVLAKNVCTNPARIRKIMSKLKKAGFISTKEGAEGGYLLAQKACDINLAQVCLATHTQLVCSNWHSGDVDQDCLICSGMGPLMDRLYHQLNEDCMDRLATITVADIGADIFGNDKSL